MSRSKLSLSSQEYWETRFSTNQDTFEWLNDGQESITRALQLVPPIDSCNRVLHVGIGSSSLHIHLRNLFNRGRDIINVDYSQSSIDLSRQAELDTFGNTQCEYHTVDLLKWQDMRHFHNIGLIVDKSTADCISTVNDYDSSTMGDLTGHPFLSECKISALQLMAYNLAAVTNPGGIWAIVSYSSTRNEFLSEDVPHGMVNLNTLWTLHSKHPIEVPSQSSNEPKINHWCYLLCRLG